MRIANLGGRLTLVTEAGGVDVQRASAGKFDAEPQAVFERWDELCRWADAQDGTGAESVDVARLGPPVPCPRQVFAIGLNYRDHAAESGFDLPESPTVFTKYVSSLTGPTGAIELPSAAVDWEVELVAVVGRTARRVEEDRAWSHIAGLTVGQDLSEREVQLAGPAPQFSLGKSFPGFAPTGPYLVTPDELGTPDDVVLGCSVNGEELQRGRTGDMVFGIASLVSRLSRVLTLYPGDVIFTGTPAGIGNARDPKRFLAPGDELVTFVEGVGEMRHRLTGRE